MSVSGGHVPRKLGRYEVGARIGAGGMSTIHLGRLAGPGGFEKRVALKVLRPRLAELPAVVELFCHEARALARLCHAHVVQVLELGLSQGLYYMAMEHLSGASLATILARTPEGAGLPPRLACRVVVEACEALHHVHEACGAGGAPLGLVHLDVSPENLFVTDAGVTKLIDFGVSHSATSACRPALGKLSYVSPEQVEGRRPDRRSDLFALGAVLWESLAGRPLFAGENALQCLYRVSRTVVPELAPAGLPARLDEVVARALARHPERRYQDAMEMRIELSAAASELGPPATWAELGALVASDRKLTTGLGEPRKDLNAAA